MRITSDRRGAKIIKRVLNPKTVPDYRWEAEDSDEILRLENFYDIVVRDAS